MKNFFVLILLGMAALVGCSKNDYSGNQNQYYPANPNSIPLCNQYQGSCVAYNSVNYIGQAGCPEGYVTVSSTIAGSGGVACMNAIVLQHSGYGVGVMGLSSVGVGDRPVQQCDPYLGPYSCGVASGLRCVSIGNRQGYCAP